MVHGRGLKNACEHMLSPLKAATWTLSVTLAWGKAVGFFNPQASRWRTPNPPESSGCWQRKPHLAKLRFVPSLLADWLTAALVHLCRETAENSETPSVCAVTLNAVNPWTRGSRRTNPTHRWKPTFNHTWPSTDAVPICDWKILFLIHGQLNPQLWTLGI